MYDAIGEINQSTITNEKQFTIFVKTGIIKNIVSIKIIKDIQSIFYEYL